MKYKKLEENIPYDGSPIEPFWAFKEHKLKGSSIVSWIGPMNIKPEELIDYEDVGLEIKSDKMVHFIIEHFDVQPADIKTCYHRQRLFVMIVKDALGELGIKTSRKGDDLYFNNNKKLSVSIATCSNSSMKIHFGMNVVDQGTPEDIETIGLLECKNDLDNEKISALIDNICESYINEIESIEEDITKTKVF
ncbi:MAG TPA: DUF366 family protein [Methanobacterium sp.]|nr:DUF366 family protein [Methanobacterium sp.]